MTQTAAEKAYHRAYYVRNRESIKAKAREFYAAHREEYIAQRKAARLADPEKFRAIEAARFEKRRPWREQYQEANRDRLRAYHRKSGTGWTQERYDEMLSAQEGCCAICGAPDERKLCADHRGNQQRGLLCRRCNLGLGYFGDSADRLRLAAEYLDSYAGEVAA